MNNNIIKILIITIMFVLTTSLEAFSQIDTTIFKDPIKNIYKGRENALTISKNLDFDDLAPDFWAKESIIRSGSLDFIKKSSKSYQPSVFLRDKDAIVLLVRLLGLDRQAMLRSEDLIAANPNIDPLSGYFSIALQYNIISNLEYNNLILQENLDSQNTFITREDFAYFLVKTIQYLDPTAFDMPKEIQSVYSFRDYNNISQNRLLFIEAIASNSIMYGDTNNNFNPKNFVTNAEVTQILKNSENFYFKALNFKKETGTLSAIENIQLTKTNSFDLENNFYIRRFDGSVDILKNIININSNNSQKNLDVVVFKDGQVKTLSSLKEGDQIEYISNNDTIFYINVLKELDTITFSGQLESFDFDNYKINLSSSTSNKIYSFFVTNGLYKQIDQNYFVTIDKKEHNINDIKKGSILKIVAKNNIIHEISYIGQKNIIPQLHGIVTDNNPNLGYISFVTNSGKEVTKFYTKNNIVVEKKNYYDFEDDLGYIDEVFPNFKYNSKASTIEEISAGDIVFLTISDQDSDTVISISAHSNYIIKYGKLLSIIDKTSHYDILVEYDNNQNSWFFINKNIFISKDQIALNFSDLKTGDYVKLLINQAFSQPGHVIESIMHIVVEGKEKHVSSIIKGQLSYINLLQNKIFIKNSQIFGKNGWQDYKQIRDFEFSKKDTQYYHNEKRINFDYVNNFFKKMDKEVYLAIENNTSNNKIKKMTFRDGRDEVLDSATVLDTKRNGNFKVSNFNEYIKLDQGTIVVKNNRLVEKKDLLPNDYAQISMNNNNLAAIVNIKDKSNNNLITIARGRINSIDEGKSFRVQSVSLLNDIHWTYTPVKRDYVIDYNTLFLDEDGILPPENFIDFSENSLKNEIFNIVVDGSKATHVIKAPYPKNAIRGEIFEKFENMIGLKDAKYFDEASGKWKNFLDSIIYVDIPPNSIISLNNNISYTKDLVLGEKLFVLTDVDVVDREILTGYIFLNY